MRLSLALLVLTSIHAFAGPSAKPAKTAATSKPAQTGSMDVSRKQIEIVLEQFPRNEGATIKEIRRYEPNAYAVQTESVLDGKCTEFHILFHPKDDGWIAQMQTREFPCK